MPPDANCNALNRQRLRSAPLVLSESQRRLVRQAIERVCQRRRWRLLAVNVRSNHVHVVVVAPTHAPEIVMGQLKSWATRDLRESSEVGQVGRLWTDHGSTRWIKDQRSLKAAIDYVLNHQ